MAEVASGVLAGEVTQAVRESTSDAGPIATGDWLGIRREGICAVQSTMAEAAIELLNVMITRDHELLTVIAAKTPTTTPPLHRVVGRRASRGRRGRGARGRPTALPLLLRARVARSEGTACQRAIRHSPCGISTKSPSLACAVSVTRRMLPSPVRDPHRPRFAHALSATSSRPREASIGDLQPGEEATVVGEVRSSRTRQLRAAHAHRSRDR